MMAFSADNFLKRLNTVPCPGTVVDIEVLDSGHFIAIFSHWIKLVTYSGEVLSSIKLQKKSISLGRFAKAFVLACVSKTLCFIEIVDFQLNIFKQVQTKVQFSGACAVTTDSLMCVAKEEPTVYVFNGRICVKTINLFRIYGMNLHSRISSRRIRLNHTGHIVISDYENNVVMILWESGNYSIVHCVDCPANIAATEKYVYIVQDAHENRVLEVSLEDHSKVCILEDEDGILYPNCVSVNRQAMIMVGMENSKPVARAYQIDYEV